MGRVFNLPSSQVTNLCHQTSQKEAFYLEWVGITESRLRNLQRWANLRVFTTAQYAQDDELLKLIARHRPLLERLIQN